MSSEEINFKDLSKTELDNLKDLYVENRLSKMSESELRSFVKGSIEDQIKGTVGNEEEKEAWLEMKNHFKDSFDARIISVMNSHREKSISPEQTELDQRIELLEKRKEEKDTKVEDMW